MTPELARFLVPYLKNLRNLSDGEREELFQRVMHRVNMSDTCSGGFFSGLSGDWSFLELPKEEKRIRAQYY